MRGLPLPKNDPRDFEQLVVAVRSGTWPAAEIARLAVHLAESGEQLRWAAGVVADVASTGGPGSLSTLLGPLALRSLGATVVKLGVSGRPAGAIDSLGSLVGYRFHSSSDEVRAAVTQCGYAHFLADDRFAPLDAALFDYRKRNAAIAIPALAIASLLAKKIAVGVNTVGLDVRVGPYGNLGHSLAVARENAHLFCEVASLLRINATAFLSSNALPEQPWLGRGESLVALALVLGLRTDRVVDAALAAHAVRCTRMAEETMGREKGVLRAAEGQFTSLRSPLAQHLLAQGTNIETLKARVAHVLLAKRLSVPAPGIGQVNFDLVAIRDVLVNSQRDVRGHSFRDPCGVEFLCAKGTNVRAGEVVALVRREDDVADGDELLERIRDAVGVSSVPDTEAVAAPMEVIRV